MRFVQLKVKEDSIHSLNKIYEREIIPVLGGVDGCLYAGLIQSAGRLDECISLTLWRSASAAEGYVAGGTYNKLLESVEPYLAAISEWKIKLTDDQKVEYVPVGEPPTVKAYNVTIAPTSPGPVAENAGDLYVRMLSVRLKSGGMQEFRRTYEHEILPALYETPGCRYAYLTQDVGDPDEALSITVWDRREDADDYEKNGRFGFLVRKISHLLTGLYQWKMSLGKEPGKTAVTSEDLTSEGYHIVAGRGFV